MQGPKKQAATFGKTRVNGAAKSRSDVETDPGAVVSGAGSGD